MRALAFRISENYVRAERENSENGRAFYDGAKSRKQRARVFPTLFRNYDDTAESRVRAAEAPLKHIQDPPDIQANLIRHESI